MFSLQGKVIREELVADAYREWRCNEWEMDKAAQLSSTDCPACTDVRHSIHTDGNMKLYIYDHNSEDFRRPYHNEIFMNDEYVLLIPELLKIPWSIGRDAASMLRLQSILCI